MIKSASHVRKMLWSKLRLSLGKEGLPGKGNVNTLMGKRNVYEEYKEAFRTKSYTEICNKFQGQLENEEQSPALSSPSSRVRLSEYLLEPCQETLTSILQSSNFHHFFANYFEISLEAGRICEFILQKVQQVHINNRAIKNVITLIERVPDSTNWTNNQYHALYRNLTSFSLSWNPFSTMTPEKFHALHESQVNLFHQLNSQCRKTKRRTKVISYIKRAITSSLVFGFGALAIALLLLVIMHSMVGLAAIPGLIVICSLGILFVMKKSKRSRQKSNKTTWLEGLGAQLDVAARGVYILINDFDTMGRLVQRLNDEMEHRKFVVDICVKKGKNEMLKEVVREFQLHESGFVEQLEELKKQIYLCFLDINRSRRLLVQEMVKS